MRVTDNNDNNDQSQTLTSSSDNKKVTGDTLKKERPKIKRQGVP